MEDLKEESNREKNHILGVNLIVEFGDDFDLVRIESESFPMLNGKEVFRGRIKSFALSEKDFDQTLSRLNPDILKRVEFFKSHLDKNSFVDPRVRKRVSAQSQSFFMDDSKTYIIDFFHRDGLTFLQMNKVYERPAEIEVNRSQGEHGRRHFHVTVKHKRPGFEWDEELKQEIETRDVGHIYYQAFLNHLMKNKEKEVFDAVQWLVERQNQTGLKYLDRVRLRTIDKYLFSLKMVDKTTEIMLTDSGARSIRDALEMRLLLFGEEPFESWLFQYDPVFQEAELDHIPLDGDYKSRNAYISTDRGFVVMRPYSASSYIIEWRDGVRDHVNISYNMTDVGMSVGDTVAVDIDTTPTKVEERIASQIKSGVQGNSDYYRHLLDDVLNSCSRHLKE